MKHDGFILEAFVLGMLIMIGLTTIEVNITVNVTDKPNHKEQSQ